MARSHFTLAALATAAVVDFDAVGARPFTTGLHGDFFAAVVTDAAGRQLIVRVPNSAQAEAQLSSEKYALETMTAGIRSRLPFDVPELVGRATWNKTFGLVFEFLPGHPLSIAEIAANTSLASSIGSGLAAVHSLPTNFVADAGLPFFTALEIQRQTRELVDRARDSKMLPAFLASRWNEAVSDDTLWMFEPTVIHGSLGADSLLSGEDSVGGVLGWAALRVGDPAWDLHWLINAPIDSQDAAFAAYGTARASLTDPKLRQRATLYSELELARWLLHGIEQKDTAIVEDAVDMLDRLVDAVRQEPVNSVGQETAPVLGVTEVVELLDETPGDAREHYRGMEPVTDDQRSTNSSSE
jgi:aminoglycoside phosphotransferase (APT) family kinase protein